MRKFYFSLFGALFVFYVGSCFGMDSGEELVLNYELIDTSDWHKVPSPTHKEMKILLFGKRLAFLDELLLKYDSGLKPESNMNKVVKEFLRKNKSIEDYQPYVAMRRLIDCILYLESIERTLKVNNVKKDLKRLFSKVHGDIDTAGIGCKYFTEVIEHLIGLRKICQYFCDDSKFINEEADKLSLIPKKLLKTIKKDCEEYLNKKKKESCQAYKIKNYKIPVCIRRNKRSNSLPPKHSPKKDGPEKKNFFY